MVWNIKSKTQRFLTLTPTPSWGGKGLIGVTIRMDNYATAEENLLRVLSVEKQSPAALAGLTPNTDYLLGTTVESFENENILAEVLEENEDNVVEIYVYNTESDVVRVVTLVPSVKWGGNGLLGAEIGRGYLHRLPKSCRDTLGVSFERKVLVNNGNETSCGAVDLKLNDMVIKDDKKESSTPLLEVKGASVSIESSHEDQSNELKESAGVEDAVVDTDDASGYADESNDLVPPSPTISKFPTTPQLQLHDFALTGTKGSSLETSLNLPPPPIPTAVESPTKEEMTSVDLR